MVLSHADISVIGSKTDSNIPLIFDKLINWTLSKHFLAEARFTESKVVLEKNNVKAIKVEASFTY